MSVFKKGGLGRGLDALIPSAAENNEIRGGAAELDITKVEPSRNQPRLYFDEESLKELCESIKQHGVLQPIIVKPEEGYFRIIAGERRFRAAKMAKLRVIPAIIKDYSDDETLQVALIENLQRDDLNPIEEAMCYARLCNEHGFTHEGIAEKISKSRVSVTNSMRLLSLDSRVMEFIAEGLLSAGHGKVLLAIDDMSLQLSAAERIAERGMSVRETERYVRELLSGEKERPPARVAVYNTLQKDLEAVLGTKIRIKNTKGKESGRIEIEYANADELDRLYLALKSGNVPRGTSAYKMVACDMDGTLLNSNNKISPRNSKAIQEAVKAGVKFVICSGRADKTLLEFFKDLNLQGGDNYIISLNGGEIKHLETGTVIRRVTLDKDYVFEILNAITPFRENLSPLVYYNSGQIYIEEETYYTKRYFAFSKVDMAVAPFREVIKNDVSKLLLLGSPKIISEVEVYLKRTLPKDIQMYTSSPTLLEFLGEGGDKGDALEFLSDKLGIPLENIIGIGDNHNDTTLIQKAGLGVAVANAVPQIKEFAQYVTRNDNNNGAVAEVIERFILNS